MAKRWKLLLGLAVVVMLGVAGKTILDYWSWASQQKEVLNADSDAEDALRAAEAALRTLSFDDGSGLLSPSQITELHQSKQALANSLEREKKKLRRGRELAKSEEPKQALWAFRGARRGFLSVADSCDKLQARAQKLRSRGKQASEKIAVAERERNSTRRYLAEVEHTDVGLPNRQRLDLSESRGLLRLGEGKLQTAKALVDGDVAADPVTAYDLAQAACELFDQARGSAEKRRGLALEYRHVRLKNFKKKQDELQKTEKNAREALEELKRLRPNQDWSTLQATLQRAKEREAEAEELFKESYRRFGKQELEEASQLLETAQGLIEEAIALARRPINAYQKESAGRRSGS